MKRKSDYSKKPIRGLKKQFRSDLERVYSSIVFSLNYDTIDGDLLPSLYCLYSHMWCKNAFDLTKFICYE